MDEVLFTFQSAAMTMCLILGLCIAVEFASPREQFRLADRFPGVALFLLSGFAGLSMAPLFDAILRVIPIRPLFDFSGLPPAVAAVTTVVIKDFLNYCQHRFDHRFFWPFHAVHHVQTDLHAANGYAHPFQAVTEFLVIFIPLIALGIHSSAVPLSLALFVSFQAVVIHSPTRVHLGPLRRLIVDSRFHRIHHSLEERHFGKNYGTVFTLWDQMFGTAYFPKDDEWPDVGLAGFDPPTGPLSFLAHPILHIRRRRDSAIRSFDGRSFS